MNLLPPLLSPSVTTAATIAALLAVLLYLQGRLGRSPARKEEGDYLRRFSKYIEQLHGRKDFDATFFVARPFRLTSVLQPRSFFISRHAALLDRVRRSALQSSAGSEMHDGYHSRNLFEEATSKREPIIVLGDPGSGKSVAARQLALTAA